MEDKEVMPDLNEKQKEVVSWFRVVMGANALAVYAGLCCIKREYEYGKFEHVWTLQTTTQTMKALVAKGYLEVVPDYPGQTASSAYRLSLKGLAVPYDDKHPALIEFQTKLAEWRKR